MGRRFLKFDGAFGPEGCGGGSAADFEAKGRGWRRGLCRRVVHRFAKGATAPTALRVVDCPMGNENEFYKPPAAVTSA